MKHIITIVLALIVAGAFMIAAVPSHAQKATIPDLRTFQVPQLMTILTLDEQSHITNVATMGPFTDSYSCGQAINLLVATTNRFTKTSVIAWCVSQTQPIPN
jgi:hypothetical protein